MDIQFIKKCKQQALVQSEFRAIELLEQQSSLDSIDFVKNLSALFNLNSISLNEMLALQPVFEMMSYSDCIKNECILLKDNETLILIYADIYNQDIENWASIKIGQPFILNIAHRLDILTYLAKYEDASSTVSQSISTTEATKEQEDSIEELSLHQIEKDTNSVIRLVRSTLFDGLKTDASDIHFEMQPSGMLIKYRIDGVLIQVGVLKESSFAEQIISRIKVLAELDITEQRIPQDGRFRAIYRNRDVDFRVSVMPSIHGEDVVIRILDKQALAEQSSGLNLDVLGIDELSKSKMRDQFLMPYGMVLVTGPTGSGKTTTLYAAISEINHGDDKIITIEDPVEYQLSGVLQIPVNEKKGLTFARGLRSILRHDPDKIMVGEIRDAETAQIAVQSALTGHLVLTSVHANNAFDVIGRFLNMGVDPYSFVSALNVVVAQRLLRMICQNCIQIAEKSDAIRFAVPDKTTFYQGKGCAVCRGTGYKGRQAVAEILILDDELRELIASRAPIKSIKALAVKKGTKFLHESALNMAVAGKTTLAEVQRVAPII